MTTAKTSSIYQAPNRNFIAQHFCGRMSSTAKKIAGVAAVGCFALGCYSSTLASYFSFLGTATVLKVAAIGFAGLTVSSLSLYIAGAALIGLSIYLCARLMFAPDKEDNEYVDFLKGIDVHLHRIQENFYRLSSGINALEKFTNENAKKTQSTTIEKQLQRCQDVNRNFLNFLQAFLPNFTQNDSLKKDLDLVVMQIMTNPLPTNPFYESIRKELGKLADEIHNFHKTACTPTPEPAT